MTRISQSWSYDPDLVSGATACQEHIRLRACYDRDVRQAFMGSPQFSFVPIMRYETSWLGPKLTPGLSLGDCPLVLGTLREARTVATRVRDARSQTRCSRWPPAGTWWGPAKVGT